MIRHLILNLAAIAMIIFAAHGAVAHDAAKGPHGGIMVAVEDRHIELSVAGADLVVHVTDAKHEIVDVQGVTGRAIVQSAGKTSTVTLAVDGNRLTGRSEQPLAKGARVVISIAFAGGRNLQARVALP